MSPSKRNHPTYFCYLAHHKPIWARQPQILRDGTLQFTFALSVKALCQEVHHAQIQLQLKKNKIGLLKLQAKEAKARAAMANKRGPEALKEPSTWTACSPSAVLHQPKHQHTEETSKFHSSGERIMHAEFQAFDFTGLIYHNRVDRWHREKIAHNEFFELYKLYKPEESSKQYVGMNEEGYLSFSVHKPMQPKTKAEVFSLLYDFGQFHLQMYPAKTVGFLEYLHYLMENTSNMMVQGVLKLGTAIRRQYINYPHWNWVQLQHEINHLLPMFKANKTNLITTAQSRHTPKYTGGKAGGKHKLKSLFGKYNSHSSDSKGVRCCNYNYKPCKFSNRCFCEHVCCECRATNHKAPACTNKQGTSDEWTQNYDL